MTFEEWNEIAKHLKSFFPNRTDFLEKRERVREWYEVMKDYDYRQMKQASRNYIDVSQFPPTVFDLRTQYLAISDSENTLKAKINDMYKTMVKYYPVCLRDENRTKAFKYFIQADTLEESVKKAKVISNKVKDRVKTAELSGNDDLPILSVCIKECANGTETR